VFITRKTSTILHFNADFHGRENNQSSYGCQRSSVACSTQPQGPSSFEVASSVDYLLALNCRRAKS
jgi:hypothetical protein